MLTLIHQLSLFGLDETVRRAGTAPTPRCGKREVQRIMTLHQMLSELPSSDDLSFLHSGFCQTCLPHSRPAKNRSVWRRSAGRFRLIVTPGVIDTSDADAATQQPTAEQEDQMFVGVPYGTKARLILIHLQTEGMRSRTVNLGPSLSAFLRSLGLPVTGGPRGSINAVREQCLRIARCTFTLQWANRDPDGTERTVITDTKIVDGMEMWHSAKRDEWSSAVELSERFHTHLREHAVPLDKRGIAHLAGNSLGLDLYTLFAYRLPKLARETHVRWESIQDSDRRRLRNHPPSGGEGEGGAPRRNRRLSPRESGGHPHRPHAAAVTAGGAQDACPGTPDHG